MFVYPCVSTPDLKIGMADNQRSIAATVERYGAALKRFVRGRVPTNADAEDVLQDVWAQLASVAEVDTIEQVSGWLHRVARNKITDRFRKKRPEALEDFAYADAEGDVGFREILLADDSDPDLGELKRIFWEELMAALDELPPEQRTVFVLNELEEVTLQEIADREGENLKTIISRKRYAVLKLRERLRTIYNELVQA